MNGFLHGPIFGRHCKPTSGALEDGNDAMNIVPELLRVFGRMQQRPIISTMSNPPARRWRKIMMGLQNEQFL